MERAQRARPASDRPRGPAQSTVWSRALYAVARMRGALRPSPVAGLHNLERQFEGEVQRVARRLVTEGLLERRRLAGYGRQYAERRGYKRSLWQESDLRITPLGRRALGPDERHDAGCLHADALDEPVGEGWPPPATPDGWLAPRVAEPDGWI